MVTGSGIEGDFYHNREGSEKRHVLLLDRKVLEDLSFKPGDLREQVLLDFPELQGLEIGTRLQLGDAVVEITMDCTPCRYMAESLGWDPEEFVNTLMRKRGMLARVVASGSVKMGDTVRVLSNV